MKKFILFSSFFLLFGNFLFAQSVFCDTECRTFPLGDCASGHTDTDIVEWPCDITLNDINLAANDADPDALEMRSDVDSLDARPQIVNRMPNGTSMTWADQVIVNPNNSYTIIRHFTVLDWITASVGEYTQVIKNTAPVGDRCGALACFSSITAELEGNPPSVDLSTRDFLFGNYALCDISTFSLEIVDGTNTLVSGIGAVNFTEEGTFTAQVTDPETGNSCWGTLIVEPFNSNCQTLVCNSVIMVSLGATPTGPSATLNSDVFLEGPYPNCDINTFEISATDPFGNTITGVGAITVTAEGTYTYTVSDPATGNSCFGEFIVEDKLNLGPFRICDTECRDTPLGDCASGHTSTDNIEWPCDITIDDNTVYGNQTSPEELEQIMGINVLDTKPHIVDYDESLIGMAYDDILIVNSDNSYKILRTWTVLDWQSGTVATYNQIIRNMAPLGNGCPLVCQATLTVELNPGSPPSLDLFPTDFLIGNYEICNTDEFMLQILDGVNSITAGIGSVSMTEVGTFQYEMADAELLNACTGTITVRDASTDCQPLICYNGITAFLDQNQSVTLYPPDFLSGDYPNCDLASFELEIRDMNTPIALGTGSVQVTEAGEFIYQVTDPSTGNSCIGNILVREVGNDCDPLACNDQVYVSMAQTPIGSAAVLDPDMFLEGAYPNCDFSTLTLTVSDSDGNEIVSGLGTVTMTIEGEFVYRVSAPNGNACWGTVIIEDKLSGCNDPFEICDTECRSTPVGDCASGHTDTDNVEWPCDITIDDPTFSASTSTPDRLEAVVDIMDTKPTLVNEGCNLVGVAFDDTVIDLGTDGYKILRNWALVHWNTGNVYEYMQLIKNRSPFMGAGCDILVCNDQINISTGIGVGSILLSADRFLEGSDPNCDYSSMKIEITFTDGTIITSGVGEVRITETGTFNYTITHPSNGNSCWGTLVIEGSLNAPCDLPFVFCDTECWATPVGDCASGHTDADLVEWPCDITIEDSSVEPLDMRPTQLRLNPNIDQRNRAPAFVNVAPDCHLVAQSFSDQVFDLGADGFKILREWTVIDWISGESATYTQILENTAPQGFADCTDLKCHEKVSGTILDRNTGLTFHVSDLLNGDFDHCNTDGMKIDLMDADMDLVQSATGSITIFNEATLNYSVTELEAGNTCFGEIVLELDPSTPSSTEDHPLFNGLNVFPNPATDVLVFDFENEIRNYTINIFDQSGKLVLSENNTNKLNISQLNNGLHIYQIQSGAAIKYGKITVLK